VLSNRSILKAAMHEVVDRFWLLNVYVRVEWLIACPKVLITIDIAIPGRANVYLTVLSRFLFWRRSVRPKARRRR
jgi:hypothetical protein